MKVGRVNPQVTCDLLAKNPTTDPLEGRTTSASGFVIMDSITLGLGTTDNALNRLNLESQFLSLELDRRFVQNCMTNQSSNPQETVHRQLLKTTPADARMACSRIKPPLTHSKK
ncbi:hypothetical protein PGTUg99_025316 [Puccinia graminis f. sp. tritici]|uniref:Uncharacterized protein n=1 Tax=Puccinia graminis f. sp. tritici TaxID=56615 RepID=A0A5B0RE32_PUCGR|nr:hypothetical protein PGTUg99_025316 [Puccinia graminis f. sp. tritici]